MGSRREALSPTLLADLAAILGEEGLLAGGDRMEAYASDGFTLVSVAPEAVLLPDRPEQVSRCLALLHAAGLAFAPRGAGTGLSGGALADPAPVQIATTRLREIEWIDLDDEQICVQAGVVNAAVSRHAGRFGEFHYAPDPSSQNACTIGGNVAENSGGPHTLKYGVTTDHVLGVELVLPDGSTERLGGRSEDATGYDLRGLAIGSEGTFGVVTRAILRLTRNPRAVRTSLAAFSEVEDACRAVGEILSRGVVPASIELMDATIVAAVREAYGFAFPAGSAVLIVEVDGSPLQVECESLLCAEACAASGALHHESADDPRERARLWQSRKKAFGAVGRLAPNYCTQDGVVPRTRIPEMIARIDAIGRKHDVRIANVMHAGDGNLHPIVLYDGGCGNEVKRVLRAGEEILEACVELGGTITGEHGIGVEKLAQMPLLFSEDDFDVMKRLREVFDPDNLANPGKVLPTPGGCIEVGRPGRQVAL